ncbi:MAG: tetratricopeptide repeat protein [Myxococcota bacterium]
MWKLALALMFIGPPDPLAEAMAARFSGDLDRAQAKLQSILAEKPNDPRAGIQLGKVHEERRDLKAARASYRKAHADARAAGDQDGVSVAAQGLALVLIELSEQPRVGWPERDTLLNEAYEVLADYHGGEHWARGVVLARQGKLPEADASLRRCITENRDLRCAGELARLYIDQGDVARALQLLEPIPMPATPTLQLQLVRARLLRGELEEAELALRTPYDDTDYRFGLYGLLVKLRRRSGKTPDAALALADMKSPHPESVHAAELPPDHVRHFARGVKTSFDDMTGPGLFFDE